MSNLLFAGGAVVQGTTLSGIFGNQLVTGGAIQPSSQACIVDLTPPTFSGINFLTRGALGQLRVSWLAASDMSSPIRYEVYVQEAPALNLFNTANIALVTTNLQTDIFVLADGSLLQSGVKYFVGVRAVDAVGNRDNNIVSLFQTTPGITGATNAKINGVFAVNNSNQLIASFWVNDNDGTINNPARLGLASYVIYDQNGSLVPSMSQNNISADSEGFYEITPVPSVLDLDNTFYTVKVTIFVDGIAIVYNLPISYAEAGPQYEPRAVFSIDAANQLQATIWITKNGEQISTNLGTASYAVYNKDGAALGISQSGIVADVNGLFKTTPVLAVALTDLTHYTVIFSITADGAVRKGAIGITVAE
jgi:hypothetical protein